MRKYGLHLGMAMLCALVLGIGTAQAAPMNYALTWSGASLGNTAMATGTITIDPSVLGPGYNDNSGFFFPANPFVSALSVTVSGSGAGDGTFGLSDFNTVLFNANGTLNFSNELVGQPTAGNAWGTPDGSSGDFNLFNRTGISPIAPDGTFNFTLTTDAGTGDSMVLTSFRPSSSVPEPASLMLLVTGLGGLFMLRRKRAL